MYTEYMSSHERIHTPSVLPIILRTHVSKLSPTFSETLPLP